MTLILRNTSTRISKGNGQTRLWSLARARTTWPQFFLIMDSVTDKKKDQIKALMERMKQEGKPIDWATIVLC
jgi:hypothetical protein